MGEALEIVDVMKVVVGILVERGGEVISVLGGALVIVDVMKVVGVLVKRGGEVISALGFGVV